jgi:hypothetical protein
VNAQAQVNAADHADVALAKSGILFRPVFARRPRVTAFPGGAIGKAPHLSLPDGMISLREFELV